MIKGLKRLNKTEIGAESPGKLVQPEEKNPFVTTDEVNVT